MPHLFSFFPLLFFYNRNWNSEASTRFTLLVINSMFYAMQQTLHFAFFLSYTFELAFAFMNISDITISTIYIRHLAILLFLKDSPNEISLFFSHRSEKKKRKRGKERERNLKTVTRNFAFEIVQVNLFNHFCFRNLFVWSCTAYIANVYYSMFEIFFVLFFLFVTLPIFFFLSKLNVSLYRYVRQLIITHDRAYLL